MLIYSQSPRQVNHKRHLRKVRGLESQPDHRYLKPAGCLVDAHPCEKRNHKKQYRHNQPYGGKLHISDIRYPVGDNNDQQTQHQHDELGAEKIEGVSVMRRIGHADRRAVDRQQRQQHEEGDEAPQIPVALKKPFYRHIRHTIIFASSVIPSHSPPGCSSLFTLS